MPKTTDTPEIAESPLFVGDVEAQSSVKVNRKGGSVTAILKKIIMDRLKLTGDHLSAATVQFDSGQSILLLGAAHALGRMQVIHIGKNRFEVVMADDDEARVDAVTEAFLCLKTAQFERGTLNVSGPHSAEDWEARAEQGFNEAERHVGRSNA